MTLRFEPIRVLNSDPILIVQIRTGLNRSVGFNERATAFTTGTACTPSSDIKNRQHRSLLEHRRRQITDVDVVKNRIRKPSHRRRRRGAAAATRRQRRATTHGVLYTRTTPVAAARAELGGRIAAGTRLSRRRGVVAVGGLAR